VTVSPHESTKVDHQSAQAEVKRSQLMRETALLEQGRAALRAGNPGQAWRILEQWAAEFPEGQLAQEREVLHIELLWRSGRRDLAAERIRAFISEHPGSAHAARLRSLLPESE
jgi:outer membrane protein assembly factor BamD (BamD/ComL family)